MQNLNDRLASYIDEVRKRDIEIGNLQSERSTIEETHIEEVTTVKTLYKKELDQLRNAVEAISRKRQGWKSKQIRMEGKQKRQKLLWLK